MARLLLFAAPFLLGARTHALTCDSAKSLHNKTACYNAYDCEWCRGSFCTVPSNCTGDAKEQPPPQGAACADDGSMCGLNCDPCCAGLRCSDPGGLNGVCQEQHESHVSPAPPRAPSRTRG